MITDILDQWYFLAITAGGAVASAILIWLIVISKDHFSPGDVEAHSSDFGKVVKEGHGPMLPYLWVIFFAVLVFVIIFWIVYWPALPTENTF
jgi:hypothetical protein